MGGVKELFWARVNNHDDDGRLHYSSKGAGVRSHHFAWEVDPSGPWDL